MLFLVLFYQASFCTPLNVAAMGLYAAAALLLAMMDQGTVDLILPVFALYASVGFVVTAMNFQNEKHLAHVSGTFRSLWHVDCIDSCHFTTGTSHCQQGDAYCLHLAISF